MKIRSPSSKRLQLVRKTRYTCTKGNSFSEASKWIVEAIITARAQREVLAPKRWEDFAKAAVIFTLGHVYA